jgi:hypothetical protein
VTNRTDRDWKLISVAADAMNTVCGCAFATIAVLPSKQPEKHRQQRAMTIAKEVAARYVELATEVQMAAFEYSPDMPEAELRAWAARMMEVVRG